jgi:hypothetical protein
MYSLTRILQGCYGEDRHRPCKAAPCIQCSTEKKQFAQQTQTQLVPLNQKIYKNQLGAMISTQENKKIFSKTRISLKANRLSPNSFVYPNQPASQPGKQIQG